MINMINFYFIEISFDPVLRKAMNTEVAKNPSDFHSPAI